MAKRVTSYIILRHNFKVA